MKKQLKPLSRLLIFAIYLATSINSYATSSEVAYSPTEISSGKLLQLALVLGTIIALILIISYGLKRFTIMGNTKHNHLKILHILPIGTKEKIILIQAGDQQILIGATQHQLQTLHHFEKPIITAEDMKKNKNFTQQFRAVLQQRQQT